MRSRWSRLRMVTGRCTYMESDMINKKVEGDKR